MKILIDADGCPVVKITQEIANFNELEVMIFCDSSHALDSKYGNVITVMKGKDSVDFELIKYVKSNDIVITQDYGLAAMCLAKGGRVINQNGMIYTETNIDQLLFSRHESSKIRKSGVRIKGPKKRTKKDNESFELAFKRLIKEEEDQNGVKNI